MPHKGTFHIVCVKPHRYHISNVTLPHATHAIPILHTDTKFHTSHTDTKHMTPPTHIKHSLCYLVTHTNTGNARTEIPYNPYIQSHP